jgi:hypothetical protein
VEICNSEIPKSESRGPKSGTGFLQKLEARNSDTPKMEYRPKTGSLEQREIKKWK